MEGPPWERFVFPRTLLIFPLLLKFSTHHNKNKATIA
jgi:hypothetical protein